ncbi:MAG: putative bifunctional diguanylate cyclase/phosphodiesterase [Hydrogenovibrio sp.]
MYKNSRYFIHFLAVGYSLIIILVAISSAIFFNYGHKIADAFKQHQQNTAYQTSLDALFNAATHRSILMVRMLNADDLFDIDSLHMEMFRYEQTVIQNLSALRKNAQSPTQVEITQEAAKIMTRNRHYQEKVYSLLMNQQKEAALKQLVEVTLPIQTQVFNTLEQLKQDYEAASEKSEAHFADTLANMHTLILWAALPIIFSLVVIALLTIDQLRRYARTQQTLRDHLEERVLQRTHELLLDRNLMHNLNEAIGIFNEDGHLEISNKKLTELRLANELGSTLSIWELLKKAFFQLDVAAIQEQVAIHKRWRGEGAALHYKHQFMMIDIAQFNDKTLPQNYYSIIFSDITELKHTQNQLSFTANYDAVTNLPNRYSFNQHIQNSIQKHPERPLHLFYIDLNDFKWVNDHLGHNTGDDFLRHAGQAFKEVLPQEAFIARLGGDEFAILLHTHQTLKQLTRLANELTHQIRRINDHHHTNHQVSCSIGIASYPEHGDTEETLIKHADYAMYQAKRVKQTPYCRFSDTMRQQLSYLHEIEESLHTAVRDKAFQVHYQPQYHLHTLKLVGAEALIRWPREDRMVPPTEFIPLAEKFGLINAIGEFVLDTAAQQLQAWSNCAIALPRVAVNTSSTQLLAGNFATLVAQTLTRHQLQPNQMDIEVTESVMMKNLEHTGSDESANGLSLLQTKGVEISIDDFGTGYSSLSYIKHLNVDRIKIDKSFIDDIELNPEARSIVRAIIKMGHSLGIKVLAEGIETPNQLDILKSLECDEGQGYLFSRPLNAEQFEQKCLQTTG